MESGRRNLESRLIVFVFSDKYNNPTFYSCACNMEIVSTISIFYVIHAQQVGCNPFGAIRRDRFHVFNRYPDTPICVCNNQISRPDLNRPRRRFSHQNRFSHLTQLTKRSSLHSRLPESKDRKSSEVVEISNIAQYDCTFTTNFQCSRCHKATPNGIGR